MRRVALVTGTRAEYGLLKPVLLELNRKAEIEAGLLVTGVHLNSEYGWSRKQIESDGVPVWATVQMYGKDLGKDFASLPSALARAVSGLSDALEETDPEIVVVLGDRLEALAGALAAFYRRTALAHLHGGENSAFHLDDTTRHAITRFAHLHFPATEASAERLRRMGEEEFRIHVCGAPGLDAIRNLEPRPKNEIMDAFGLSPRRHFVIFLFHPETARWREAGDQARRILEILCARNLEVLALYPNGDPGSPGIAETLKQFASRVTVRRNLARIDFLHALLAADALVGNSSCGLIEASFKGIPVLNVGERNRGREHGKNVVFVPSERKAIEEGLSRVLDPEFKERAKKAPCPWGDGTAGEKIAEILAEVRIDDKLLSKRLTF